MGPDPAPRYLIQMSGMPGSGKSTLARLLAQSIDAIVIDHDLIRSSFLESNIPFDQAAKLGYRLQWVIVEDLMKQGRSVIVDSVCNYDEVIEQGNTLGQQYGYDYRYIECRVKDIDLLDQRLKSRVPLRSQRTGVNSPPPDAISPSHKADGRALFKNRIENPCRPLGENIIVDSTSSPKECLDQVLSQLVRSPVQAK